MFHGFEAESNADEYHHPHYLCMCIVNCPFGAISDKGQIFQLIHAIKEGQRVIAIVALVVNVVILVAIIKRAKAQKKNPYKQEVFTDQKDFQEAMARA